MTRLLSFELDGWQRLGCLVDGRIVDVERRLSARGLPTSRSVEEFIGQGPDYWALAEAALATAQPSEPKLASVRLLAPLEPPVVICGGANFQDHLAETGRGRPERVEFFFKSPTTVIGPHDDVRMDPRVSTKYDYEVELGIVIGRAAARVRPEDALTHVFGYLVVNDVSIRDHQIVLDDDGTSHGRFGPGKTFRDACPMGPWVVTTSEIADPALLELETRVDGEVRQRSDMRHAIWSVPELVSYYSHQLTLQPGWVIAAGTPAGPALGGDIELGARPHELGAGAKRGGYVQPGRLVECRVDGIGTLRNRYVVGA